MLFETVRKGTRNRIVSVSVAHIPSRDQYLVQIATPYGIALDKGVVAKFGAYNSGALPIRRCDRAGCYVEMTASPSFIDALRAASGGGGSLTVVADGTGKPVTLPLSLKGVNDAYGMMVKLAKEKAVAASAANATNVPLMGPLIGP
jgi:invasion protein IalB